MINEALVQQAAAATAEMPNSEAWGSLRAFFRQRGLDGHSCEVHLQAAWSLRRKNAKLSRARTRIDEHSDSLDTEPEKTDTQEPTQEAPEPLPPEPAIDLQDVLPEPPRAIPAAPGRPKVGLGMPGQRWGIRSI